MTELSKLEKEIIEFLADSGNQLFDWIVEVFKGKGYCEKEIVEALEWLLLRGTLYYFNGHVDLAWEFEKLRG
ncbi:MAG: hypothetical protein QXL57_02395 [Candidatus Bathyarchaeia archaeon]